MVTNLTAFALFILRVFVGLVITGYGIQKLFGWFDGSNFDSFTEALHRVGVRPARFWT
jgi:putative oxidoreductase